MKKQFKLLGLLLVAGLTFAACSSDDIVKDQNTSGKWTATATVGKALRTQTRALTDDEGSLKVGWAENEKVIVFAKDGTSVGGVVGYLEPNMDGYESGSTVEMIGTLEGNSYAEGDEFFLRFPRSEVNYNGQDGTLKTIAELYDYAEGTAKVKAVNGTTVLLEDDIITLPKGNSINIPVKAKHSLQNPYDTELKIIEVQKGDYISEDDIIRYEDCYGRV